MGFHDLLPDGDDGTPWSVGGGARWQLVDDGFASPDDAGSSIAWDAVADSEARFTCTPMRDMLSSQGLTVYLRYQCSATPAVGMQLRAMIKLAAGGSFYGSYQSLRTDALWDWLSFFWPLNPFTGLPFTKAELDSIIIGGTARDTSAPNDTILLSAIVGRVAFTAAPAADAPRERITRTLRQSCSPEKLVERTVPIAAGDVRMLGLLPQSHPDGPSVDGLGWGDQLHQRRPTINTGRRYDPGRYTFRLTAMDMVPGLQLYSLYRSLRSRNTPAANLPGLARADAGALEVLTRASRAWVASPDGRVVGLADDQLKVQRRGTLFEPGRVNSLLRSSFKSGVTGLTAVGTAGQSTADTGDLLLDQTESPNSLKILRNGTAEDQGRTWPATAGFAANTQVIFSIDYKNDTGVALSWYLQRSTDSKYLRASDWTWQTGIQYNALPVVTTRSPDNRYWSPPVVVDTTGTPTLTLSVVHRTADASGTASHVYHAQIEAGTWASSRKVTDAATFSGAADRYVITSSNPPHAWPVLRGTGFALLFADWDSTTVVAGGKSIVRVNHDGAVANQQEDVTFNVGSGNFRFSRTISGTVHRAMKTQAVLPGVPHVVAWRWVSNLGELGLAPGTTSIFVDGARGTDAAPAQGAGLPFCPVPGATMPIGIGCNPDVAGQEWGGMIAEVLVSPRPYSDEEIADYSAYLLATASATT